MAQISDCIHSIFTTKFYSMIVSNHYHRWNQVLRQALSKELVRVEIDFSSFTFDLFLKQYVNVGDLMMAITRNRALNPQQHLFKKSSSSSTSSTSTSSSSSSSVLEQHSPVKQRVVKKSFLGTGGGSGGRFAGQRGTIRFSSTFLKPPVNVVDSGALLENGSGNGNNSVSVDDNTGGIGDGHHTTTTPTTTTTTGATSVEQHSEQRSSSSSTLFIDANDPQDREDLDMILMRDQSSGVAAIEFILRELPAVIDAMLEEHIVNTVSKYDMYKRFLYHNLNVVVFRYGEQEQSSIVGAMNSDGSQMVHYVDVVFKSQSKLHWLKKPCGFMGQVHGNHMKFMHYATIHYLIPELCDCIRSVMKRSVSIQIDWDSIAQLTNEHEVLTCHRTLYHSQSVFVMQRISRAFDHLSSVESEEMLDIISNNIQRIIIRQSNRRHHMFNADTRTIILHLVLKKTPQDPSNGGNNGNNHNNHNGIVNRSLYDIDDYCSIIKYCGLYSGNRYPIELQSAAASLPCLIDSITFPLKDIIGRHMLWMPNVDERRAFKICKQFIDKKIWIEQPPVPQESRSARKHSIFAFNRSDSIPLLPQPEKPLAEQPLCAWHVVKFNANNMAQERILFLTTQAYYVFRYDFSTGKLEESYFKRHDLCDISRIEIGEDIVNIYTSEIRRRSLFYKYNGKIENQASHCVNSELEDGTDDYIENHPRIRIVKDVIVEDNRPPLKDDQYSNAFMFIDPDKSKIVIKEIAWIIYGACALRKGEKWIRPMYNPEVTRPKATLSSLFYNKLGMGLTSNMDHYWSEYRNPLYNKSRAFKEVRIDAVENDDLVNLASLSSMDDDDIGELGGADDDAATDTEMHPDENDIRSMDEDERNKRIMQRYQVEQQIDSGTEGRIYLAVNSHNKRRVAIKAMPYTEEQQQVKIDQELELVRSIQHPTIVHLYETFILTSDTLVEEEKDMYMVMEYCETNLEKVIRMMKGRHLNQKLLVSWLVQIAAGLAHMHSKGIMHRDVKSQNILLKTHDVQTNREMSPGKWRIKICDFGVSARMETEQQQHEANTNMLYGTPLYMAPEIATFKPHDTRADVWSFGVIVIQLLLLQSSEQMPNISEGLSKKSNFVEQLLEGRVCASCVTVSLFSLYIRLSVLVGSKLTSSPQLSRRLYHNTYRRVILGW